MAKQNKNTTIQLSKKMRDELKALGTKGETYDEIIKRLIKVYKGKENGT
ncbi:hypothetical protein KAU88_07135 [Candidatus Bathyarchaeota archaeon]|nr:hypothetical protein [Candidatus Bathyarchaeota archaeon]